MKFYESKENTPLSFYKIFMYVFLPLGAAGCIYSLISYIFLRELYSFFAAWYLDILIVQGFFGLIRYAFLFYSMLKWKKYTFALIIVLLAFGCAGIAFSVVYGVTSTMPLMNYSIIPDYQMPLDFSYMIETMTKVIVIITAVVSAVLYTLMFFYFYKRKRLFDGVPYKIPPNNARYYTPQQPYPPQNYCPAQYCQNCGALRPSTEYRFCPECGKEY